MEKKRILITGSSGEIGTNLGLKLLDEGHEVYGIDVRPNTWTDQIPTIIQDLSVSYSNHINGIGNVIYPDNLDVVVHLAAHAKVHELVKNPLKSIENVTMIFNTLEFCRNNSIPIIYSSSREVYGDIYRYITDENKTNIYFTESPYSASKISGEAFVYSYAKCYNIPYIVFRFSNVYGRYDNDLERMERVIPLFIKKIRNNEPITIYGKNKILDFTYIDDCIKGIVKGIYALSEPNNLKETINLAFGQGNTLLEMVKYIEKATNKKSETVFAESKIGEVTHYIANIQKAYKILDYTPSINLEEGIKRAVNWNLHWEKKASSHPIDPWRQSSIK